jgi:hypothetical protein
MVNKKGVPTWCRVTNCFFFDVKKMKFSALKINQETQDGEEVKSTSRKDKNMPYTVEVFAMIFHKEECTRGVEEATCHQKDERLQRDRIIQRFNRGKDKPSHDHV